MPINNVNLSAPTDFNQAAADNERARQYAMALQQQGQEGPQGQQVGGFFVAPSWTQHANRLAQMLGGAYLERQANDQRKALGQQAQADFANWAGGMSDQMSPQQKMAFALRGMQNPLSAPIAQQVLAQQLKGQDPFSLRKGEVRYGPNGQVLASNAEPTVVSRTAEGINPTTGKADTLLFMSDGSQRWAGLQPRDKMEVAPNGQVYNPYSVQPGTTFNNPNQPFSIGVDGQPTPNKPYQDFRIREKEAGKTDVRVNVPVNTEKSYFGNVAEGLAKQDVAAIDAARAAPDQFRTAQRIIQTLNENPITGTGANIRAQFEKALSTAGIIDPKNVRATEALVSDLANMTLSAVRGSGLGAGQGFTDKDLKFLESAKSGNIEMTPDNLRRVAVLMQESAVQAAKKGNETIRRIRSAGPQIGAVAGQLEEVQMPTGPVPLSPTAQSYLDKVK